MVLRFNENAVKSKTVVFLLQDSHVNAVCLGPRGDLLRLAPRQLRGRHPHVAEGAGRDAARPQQPDGGSPGRRVYAVRGLVRENRHGERDSAHSYFSSSQVQKTC